MLPVPEARIMVSGPISGTDSVRRAFRPAVAAVDSGGECRLTRSSGSGATTVSAGFPSLAASQSPRSAYSVVSVSVYVYVYVYDDVSDEKCLN